MGETAIPDRFPATDGEVFTASLSTLLDLTLGSRLTFAGRLDPVVLSRAVRLLLDFEPVLGCWWDARGRRSQWVRCANLDAHVPFALVESDDPDRDAAAFHATPFDSRGPRLVVALLRSGEGDDLCLRFDHLAGDGWSAKEVAHLIAETYTRLLGDPEYRPAPRVTPRPCHADVWAALTEEQREAAAKTPPMLARSKWPMKVHAGPADAFYVRSLTLPADRVAEIRAHAHARGATVNEALVAAVIRASAAIFPQKAGARPGVSISTDTRRFSGRPEFDRIAMIATTQTAAFDYSAEDTFDETLQRVVDGVKPYRESLWNIATNNKKPPSPVLLRAVMGFVMFMMRRTHSGGLLTMNIGPFDEARLRFGELSPVSAVSTGPIPRYGGFPATISYYRGALTIWMGVRGRWLAPELAERYLVGIESELALQPLL